MRSIFRPVRRPRRMAAVAAAILSIAALLTTPATTANAVEPTTPAPILPRDTWFALADSSEMPAGSSLNAIDGDPATAWHTQYIPTATPLPHSISLDSTDNNLVISGLRYKPRSDGNRNGNIGRYEISVYNHSTSSWDSNPVASGTFADDSTEKTVRFPPVHTSGVRLKALTEAGNRGPWSSAAEIDVIGYAIHPLPQASMTLSADSTDAGYPAGNAIDGDPATSWQSARTALPHGLWARLNTTRIISGLRYLPRTDRPEGRIGGYQIHVSDDAANWGNPVASGTFADDGAEKTVVFQPVSARFVRLTALTEAGNRGPLTAAAEIELIGYGYPDPTLSRAGWTATSDSAESPGWPASSVIDGNVNTAWHTQVAPTTAALPHWLTIDMHATNTVSGLRYRPRADGHSNGNIGQYQIHVSTDGANWGDHPVASDRFADDSTEKIVVFQPVSARFVRLTALTEAGNRGPWSAAAEINLTDNLLADVRCLPAPIYSFRSDGRMTRYEHMTPATGDSGLFGQRLVAAGDVTGVRHAAGRDGVIYSAFATGALHRRRWNGTGWDRFADGLTYEVIDRNPAWAAIARDASLTMTVDSWGDIYTTEQTPDPVDNGKLLYWRRYNPTTHVMEQRLIASGSGVTAMFSSGPGVLYLRYDWTGSPLFRREYDLDSQRWRETRIRGDWSEFRELFSPGGDVLYGRRDNGDLMWFRVNPESGTLANGLSDNRPVGMRVNTAPLYDVQTFAAPDRCQSVNPRPFIRPEVTYWPQAPVKLAVSRNGHLHYSYADRDGRAVYAELTDLTGGSPGRLAAVPGLTGLTGTVSTGEHADGRIQIVGTGLDAKVHSNTRTNEPGGPWGTATSLGGYVSHAATVAQLGDDTISVLAPDQRTGLIWTRTQGSPNSELGVWRCNADRIAPRVDNSPLTVVQTFDVAMTIIGRDRDGTFHARSDEVIWPDYECRHVYDQVGTWQSLGGTGFTSPASAILMPGRTVQVFATGSDGVVYTQRETTTGFPGTWTAIPGITASGPPSATIAPDGLIKIVARNAADGSIHWTSQTAAESTLFAPWQAIEDSDDSATDPTAVAVPGSNTWVVAYRTDLEVPRLRPYRPGPAIASGSSFGDIPMIPPSS